MTTKRMSEERDEGYCVKITKENAEKFPFTYAITYDEQGNTFDLTDLDDEENKKVFKKYDFLKLCKNGSLYGYIGNTSYDIEYSDIPYSDKDWKEITRKMMPSMQFLNFNIQKVENALLNYTEIEKISKMRVANGDIGESSIGGLVSVRVWKDTYEVTEGYKQSGNTDGLKDTERLVIEFPRINIWDQMTDIEIREDGTYYDTYNKEEMTWDDMADLAINNGAPRIYEDTGRIIKKWVEELKVEAEKCSHCGSTNLSKEGTKRHADGLHQRWICNDCNHISTSEWVF